MARRWLVAMVFGGVWCTCPSGGGSPHAVRDSSGQRRLGRLYRCRRPRPGLGRAAQGLRAGEGKAGHPQRTLCALDGAGRAGEVDACVGSYHEESSDVLYPRWNFDTDHIYALGLASSPQPTPQTLGNYRLAWVRGYDYQDYLPNVRRYNEVLRRTGIVSMLTQNRADFYMRRTDRSRLGAQSGKGSFPVPPHAYRRVAVVPVLCQDPAGPQPDGVVRPAHGAIG